MWSTEVFLKDRWLQAAELRASPQGLEHLKPCAWLSGHYMGTAACILKSKPEAQPSSGISPSTGAGTPEHPNRPKAVLQECKTPGCKSPFQTRGQGGAPCKDSVQRMLQGAPLLHRAIMKSQNSSVGKDLKDHLIPTRCCGLGAPYYQAARSHTCGLGHLQGPPIPSSDTSTHTKPSPTLSGFHKTTQVQTH